MTFNSLKERNEFIEDNLPLVTNRVMKRNKGIFDRDLFQVGAMGLIDATDRFDKSRYCSFSTYAVKYIDGYILKYKNHDSLIKPLRRKSNNGCFQYKDIVSLDALTKDSGITFLDKIRGYDSLESDVINSVFFDWFIGRLNEREKTIIKHLMNNKTKGEISKILCISRTQASMIIKTIREMYEYYQSI